MNDKQKLEEAVEFVENPEPRCPCVLLLDTSSSMSGEPIDALNDGLQTFKNDLTKDLLASKRIEVAVVTFDDEVRVIQDFAIGEQFEPPTLTAQGLTFMGAGIKKALDMVQARKKQYKDNGVDYYRPWIFMITDGEPQGELESVVREAGLSIKDEEAGRHVVFYAVGVEGANMELLGELAVRAPVKLRGLNFTEMFTWLSKSMKEISHSRMDEQIALPPPGWAMYEP